MAAARRSRQEGEPSVQAEGILPLGCPGCTIENATQHHPSTMQVRSLGEEAGRQNLAHTELLTKRPHAPPKFLERQQHAMGSGNFEVEIPPRDHLTPWPVFVHHSLVPPPKLRRGRKGKRKEKTKSLLLMHGNCDPEMTKKRKRE